MAKREWKNEWNATEQRILQMWIDSGMTQEEAEARLLGDLDDAAVEDGYDGPQS